MSDLYSPPTISGAIHFSLIASQLKIPGLPYTDYQAGHSSSFLSRLANARTV